MCVRQRGSKSGLLLYCDDGWWGRGEEAIRRRCCWQVNWKLHNNGKKGRKKTNTSIHWCIPADHITCSRLEQVDVINMKTLKLPNVNFSSTFRGYQKCYQTHTEVLQCSSFFPVNPYMFLCTSPCTYERVFTCPHHLVSKIMCSQ